MSEPIPESIPTSSDRRSHRPTKKRALTPLSKQSAEVEALFANPDREIVLPSGEKTKAAAAPPEIVANVQGSSAGAGSGEFHVYKASRRREYERLRLMDEEVEKEEKDREFREKKEELKKAEEEKLSKNQAKRAKARARKEKADAAKKGGKMEVDGKEVNGAGGGVKKKLGAAKVAMPANGGKEEDVKGAGGEVEAEGAAEQEGGGITIVDDD
ncbi:uncharacterized protein LTR77_000767 [Saxophila tyrrhenica]|uniref:DUF1168-domain-containing protein n=1 Tax=Saxophila tyrrhenica TaxID=1690608 RepID=A0AAV9PTI2_9PEZI|nr:hypothetical protein LTR77_000767 [Saxophila tyrrhenica]